MNKTKQINDRLVNVREIETIVSTLRALAVAHQLEARTHLDAIHAHEASVAAALSTALSMLPAATAKPAEQRGMAIVIGAAQGFSGTFAERIADAAHHCERTCRAMTSARTSTSTSTTLYQLDYYDSHATSPTLR